MARVFLMPTSISMAFVLLFSTFILLSFLPTAYLNSQLITSSLASTTTIAKPAPFFWGAVTSPYEVEGGITNNDWAYFTTNKTIIERVANLTENPNIGLGLGPIHLHPAGNAIKEWEPAYYLADFDRAKSTGMNSFIIGIEWARIEPFKGQYDQDAINHYKEMIAALRERGLTPLITINHFTLPEWVLTPPVNINDSTDPYYKSLRGWESNDTVDAYVEYVKRIVPEFKDQVDHWLTMNEPVGSVTIGGYLSGVSSPGFFHDYDRAKDVLHNVIVAHVRAYDAITSLDDIDADLDGIPKNVGFKNLMYDVRPALTGNYTQNVLAAKDFAYFMNDYFLNAVINGEEDLHYLNGGYETGDTQNTNASDFIIHSNWKNKLDFVGVDYYNRVDILFPPSTTNQNNSITTPPVTTAITSTPASNPAQFLGGIQINKAANNSTYPHGILSDSGWEIYPKGLYEILVHIEKTWNKPVLITENGIADSSENLRSAFIVSHIEQLKRAMDSGVDVLGYFHWTLTDNYDFPNLGLKFGLYSVDLNDPNLVRHETNSVNAYKFIINQSNSLIAQNNNNNSDTSNINKVIITDSIISRAAQLYGAIY
jgi:beta-glucosidase